MTVPETLAPSEPAIEFDMTLIRKLNRLGPRYTSYPTADRFSESFDYGDYLQAVAAVRARGGRNPLSLYLHILLCTSLSDEHMSGLMAHLRYWFDFAPDEVGEYSIEGDPRTVTSERILALRMQGFNRISLGVQDFDPAVQKAVNRMQPESETLEVIAAARDAGFRSISIDLIYGLPKQNMFSMARTLSKVVAAGPDRIAVYNYAHMPHLFKSQRLIDERDLPSPDEKLDMLALCIRKLTEAGYVYIGMDHFAKPEDDLAVAQRQGRLHRNFQGYSTHADSNLVACGVSAISAVCATYSQNVKTLDAYYKYLDRNELPVTRGIKLNMDDMLRR